MSRTNYRFITFRQPLASIVPPQVGLATDNVVDLAASVPELAERMDGWEVINTQIIPIGEDALIVFSLRVNLEIPDSMPLD